MFALEQAILLSGGEALEDAFAVADHFCCLLDGATGIGPRVFDLDQTDAKLLVRLLLRAFEDQALKFPESDLRDLVAAAHRSAISQLLSSRPELAELDVARLPRAAGIFVRGASNHLDALVYGDCVGALRSADGTIALPMADDRLAVSERRVVDRAMELRRAGVPPELRRAELIDIVLTGRRSTYQPRNCSVLTLAPESVASGMPFRHHLAGEARLLLASDGFMREPDIFGRCTRAEFFARVMTDGVAAAAVSVRALEHADPGCTAGPRLKQYDDASAAIIRWSPQ